MKLFSERNKFKDSPKFQLDSVSDELKNRLWNVLCDCIWENIPSDLRNSAAAKQYVRLIWHDYFKNTFDSLGSYWSEIYPELRGYFFNCTWHEVYAFLEFIVSSYPTNFSYYDKKKFCKICNNVLQEENSAYRFVDERIVSITSEGEIDEIEEATTSPYGPVNEHIKTAIHHFSNKKDPDYRNSIKESICAVESLCKIISGNKKATLAAALKELKKVKNIKIHPALESAFNKLYGYTSDEKGIRHSLLGKDKIRYEDAKFMLVSCSAFINYLKEKNKN